MRFWLPLFCFCCLSGCSSWFYGHSNEPKPVPLPEIASSVATDIIWQKSLGAGGAKEQYVLVPDHIGDDIFAISANGHFYRLRAENGEVVFHVALKNRISSGVTAAGGAVFVGAENGDIIALSQSDGQMLWRKPLGAMTLARPVVSDGLLLAVTTDSTVTALSPEDGDILWRYSTQTPMIQMRGDASVLAGGGVVMMVNDLGYFTVLDAKTGLPLAQNRVAMGLSGHRIGNLLDQNALPKANRHILFGSVYQNKMYALNLETGAVLWENKTVHSNQDFAISPSDIYVTTPHGSIVALRQGDGSMIWKNEHLRGRKLSPPLAIPKRVAALDFEGHLIWLDADSGALIGQKKIGKVGSFAPPLVLDQLLIWQLQNGQLVAFRPQ